MKIIFVIPFLICAIQCSTYLNYDMETLQKWEEFKLTFNKEYNSISEDKIRLEIFAERLQQVNEHNKLYESGEVTFKQTINEFSDLTQKEFFEKFTGLDSSAINLNTNDLESELENDDEFPTFMEPANIGAVPSTIDWRKKGAVTPVKNQSLCSSSWSFSAIGAMEGQHFRKTGKLIPLSAQNLIDCATKFGSHGCRGGLPNAGFLYVKANQGIETEKAYPYQGKDLTCRYNHMYNANVTVKGVVKIRRSNEKDLMTAVATTGPVAASIDVHHDSFMHYTSGVYYEPKCQSDHLGHSVLIVGYGSHYKLGDFWIVKNSWGEKWGIHGYIFMARNKRNNCGIATAAIYPLV